MDFVFALIAIGLFAAGSLLLDKKKRAELGAHNSIPPDFAGAFFGKLKVTRKKVPLLGWRYNRGVFRGYALELRDDDRRGECITIVRMSHGIVHPGVIDILKKREFDPGQGFSDDPLFPTGDACFDKMFRVAVPNGLVGASLLGPEVRRMMADIAGPVDYFHFTEEQCSAGVSAGCANSVDQLAAAARKMAELLDAIREGGDVRQRLMANLRIETITAAKLAGLRHLVTAFPADGEILELLNVLLNDESAEVRFEAACRLGDTGMRHITLLLKNGKLGPEESVRAIALLGKNRYPKAVPVMREMYAKSNLKMKAEILKAFLLYADTALDDFLAGEARSRNRDVRLHAVKALATCGTVSSVELLHRLAHGKGDPVLAALAQESMKAIQAGLTGAKGGWLSVGETGAMDGALSRGDGPVDGALSVHQGDRVSKKKKNRDR